MKNSWKTFIQLWTTTSFGLAGLSDYAEKHLIIETRTGLMSMSMLLMVLVVAAMGINSELGLGTAYFNTYIVVAVLATHIFFSARSVGELKTLNMLGITLLVLSATAFVSIAHQTGGFTPLLFSNVVLLFMLVPMIPWGLREASVVIMLIYFMITLSIAGRAGVFEPNTVWNLQFFMVATGLISAALVAFNARVRRDDLQARFELEVAHDRMYRLSNVDPLTGVWNRRFLPAGLTLLKERFNDDTLHYMIFDLDDFKQLNDDYGHDYGDKILLLVSDCFSTYLADDGFLIRFGGDEFVTILVSENPDKLLDDIRQNMEQKLQQQDMDEKVEFGLSFGWVTVKLDANVHLDELYKQADDILCQIKRDREQNQSTMDNVEKKQYFEFDMGKGIRWRITR